MKQFKTIGRSLACAATLALSAGAALADNSNPSALSGYLLVGDKQEVAFDGSIPTLSCAVGLACVVELEDGEVLADSLLLSDPDRWDVTLRIRDDANYKTTIGVVASSIASTASLSFLTNKRSYYVLLQPSATNHTPVLSFTYPGEEVVKASISNADVLPSAQDAALN